VSIRQLCDAGCIAVFDKNTVVITLNDTVIMSGKRDPESRLWHLNLPPPGFTPALAPPIASRPPIPRPTVAFANAARLSASPAKLVTFAHAALFSPSLSTLCTALDLKHVTGFPGLTSKLVRKYPPQSVATAMGHMDQSRKNQRSSKPKFSPLTDETATDTFPASPPSGKRTHHIYVAVTDPDQTGKIFSNQTGCFIIPSSTGSTQLFILYNYNSNHAFAEPMKNKTSASILDAYALSHTNHHRNADLGPPTAKMDGK
jgi:hypothetical protein